MGNKIRLQYYLYKVDFTDMTKTFMHLYYGTTEEVKAEILSFQEEYLNKGEQPIMIETNGNFNTSSDSDIGFIAIKARTKH